MFLFNFFIVSMNTAIHFRGEQYFGSLSSSCNGTQVSRHFTFLVYIQTKYTLNYIYSDSQDKTGDVILFLQHLRLIAV